MTEKFKVEFLEEAVEFIENLGEKVRDKIIYKTYYRLFAFWDKTEKVGTVVLSTHGIIKKTDKISQGDIDRAERLRKLYFDLKGEKK